MVWAGGPRTLALILLAQLVMVAFFALDPRICVALMGGTLAVIFVLEQPILGVGLLLVMRLLSTGATVFLRIGKMGIGPYEPALVLCLVALVARAVFHQEKLWRAWPWRAPFLAFCGWVGLSLLWCVDKKDGLGDLIPLGLVLANLTVILCFVKTWEDYRLMLWFWLGGCVAIGLIAIATDSLGVSVTEVTFKAASGGGRETGLGQQPNWFAMNLMFIIHTAFGMALIEKQRLVRLGIILSAFFVFVMMLKSGSRGGAYATLIGGGLAALAHPMFRKWFLRFAVITGVVFAIVVVFDPGNSAKAFNRILSNLSLRQNFRQMNWLVCLQMFADTWGRGIGAGGYDLLLPKYNNYVAQSLYDYPHGIFWELVAHYGIVGVGLVGWLVARVVGMTRDLVRMARGTEAEVFAWTMPATMLGYAAWSFVEFTMTEKPFWEFLALYTALYLVVKRLKEQGKPIPEWRGALPRLLGRELEAS